MIRNIVDWIVRLGVGYIVGFLGGALILGIMGHEVKSQIFNMTAIILVITVLALYVLKEFVFELPSRNPGVSGACAEDNGRKES